MHKMRNLCRRVATLNLMQCAHERVAPTGLALLCHGEPARDFAPIAMHGLHVSTTSNNFRVSTFQITPQKRVMLHTHIRRRQHFDVLTLQIGECVAQQLLGRQIAKQDRALLVDDKARILDEQRTNVRAEFCKLQIKHMPMRR